MDILLIYASNSGGTFLASGIVAEILKKHQQNVSVRNVRDINPDELAKYDYIILGSPSWDQHGNEGQPQEDFINFIEKMKGKKVEKPFAIFGLGDSSFTYFCGAVGHLEDFVRNLDGQLITPSLKIDGFYYDQDKNSQIIANWAEKLSTALV